MFRLPLVLTLVFLVFSAPAQDFIRMAPLPKLVEEGSAGPWGLLEYYKVRLSCPPDYLSLIPIPSQQTEWIFPFETEEELKAWLARSDFTDDEIKYLLGDRQIIFGEESLRIFPTEEVIIGMPTSLRMRLYRLLGQFPENTFHHRPSFLNTANVSRYFRDSAFSLTTLKKIAKLAYPTPSGHGFFLSDIPFLMGESGGSEDERRLMNALLRVPAFMVRLNLSDVTSPEDLASYWTGGFNNKQVLPLFDSVIENPHVDRLDIGHLLPPIARRNLNSFPSQDEGLTGRFPDWFWTCYNFFRFTPKNVYANSEEYNELLESEFKPGDGPYAFGDLLLLKSNGRTIHGCIYIGDEIVFTKNGAGLFSPTILMKLQDVVSFHDLEGDVRLEHYRKITEKSRAIVLPSGAFDAN